MAFISYFSEVSQKSDVACSLLVSKEDEKMRTCNLCHCRGLKDSGVS